MWTITQPTDLTRGGGGASQALHSAHFLLATRAKGVMQPGVQCRGERFGEPCVGKPVPRGGGRLHDRQDEGDFLIQISNQFN